MVKSKFTPQTDLFLYQVIFKRACTSCCLHSLVQTGARTATALVSYVPPGHPERLLRHNAAARHGGSDGIPLTKRIAGSGCSDGWAELFRVCHHTGGLLKL